MNFIIVGYKELVLVLLMFIEKRNGIDDEIGLGVVFSMFIFGGRILFLLY